MLDEISICGQFQQPVFIQHRFTGNHCFAQFSFTSFTFNTVCQREYLKSAGTKTARKMMMKLIPSEKTNKRKSVNHDFQINI